MTTIELPPTTVSHPTPAAAPTAIIAPTLPKVERGWHDDPFDQHALRFHDGDAWTEHVTHHGPVPCQGCHPYAR